ncbi:MAG: hypothetical protein Q7U89_05450 [Coriobacteriia bacterium]|nr:hypothetical protein [Coriobacteriia bacterium]
MRRARIAGLVLAVRLVLALALLPLLAYAADGGAPSFEGIYAGIGDGVGNDGGGGSAAVTVWVEDLGDSARFTIQVLDYGITVAAEGPITADAGAITVPITVDSMGVSGSATITMALVGDTWLMTAEGAGTALGYDGIGSLTADQVSTGFELPPIGEQLGTMIQNITGGPAKAKEQATKTPYVVSAPKRPAPGAAPADSQDATSTSAAPAAEAPSPLAPAVVEPPFTDFNRIGAAALAAAILLLQIILA